MFRIPAAGQSINNGMGDSWLVHSVTGTPANTVLKLGPWRGGGQTTGERCFAMSLNDYRIFCTFSGIRSACWAEAPAYPQVPRRPTGALAPLRPNGAAEGSSSHEDAPIQQHDERAATARTGAEL